MNHITEIDSITRHPKEKEEESFMDLLFQSLDRKSETLDVTSEVSPSAAIESSILPEIDQSEIEYAPNREEGKKNDEEMLLTCKIIYRNSLLPSAELPYRPEFEIDLSSIPQAPNYAVYEFGHLLDIPSSIRILFEEEEEGQSNHFPQDEFEFGMYSIS
jgi:hypothetical protein